MPFVRHLTLALFAFGMSIASAHAAPITLNLDFSASGFGPMRLSIQSWARSL